MVVGNDSFTFIVANIISVATANADQLFLNYDVVLKNIPSIERSFFLMSD